MSQVLIGVFVVLLLIILVTLFRISRLVSVVKGSDKKVSSANRINALLLISFAVFGLGLFVWYTFTYADEYTLPVASDHGVLTDRLFLITMVITGFVFVVTNLLLFFFPYKYQYSEDRRAHFYPHNNKLELIWTVIPAIVLSILVFTGLSAWNDITAPASEDAVELEILGYQFAWKARYAGHDGVLGDYDFRKIDEINEFGLDLADQHAHDDFIPQKITIPVGQEIHFKIRARDVLHSVFAPHFRLKMDAVPGMPTDFKFTANTTTAEMRQELGDPEFNYEIACTEVCGRGHFSMKMLVEVVTPEEYQAWYEEQSESLAYLKVNPNEMEKVPANLREVAMVTAGMEPVEVSTDEMVESTL